MTVKTLLLAFLALVTLHGARAIYSGTGVNAQVLAPDASAQGVPPNGMAPYFVSLLQPNGPETNVPFCAGSLVNLGDVYQADGVTRNSNSLTGKVVITSASCFEDIMPSGTSFLEPGKLGPAIYVGSYKSTPEAQDFVPTGKVYKRTTYGTWFPCTNSIWDTTGKEILSQEKTIAKGIDMGCYPAIDATYNLMKAGLADSFTPTFNSSTIARAAGIDYTPGKPELGYDVAFILLDSQIGDPAVVASQIAIPLAGMPWVAGNANALKPGAEAGSYGGAGIGTKSDPLVIFGVGTTNVNDNLRPGVHPIAPSLRQVSVPIAPAAGLVSTVFAAGADRFTSLGGQQIFTGNGFCTFDNGGPAIRDNSAAHPSKDIQLGIISYRTPGPCGASGPGGVTPPPVLHLHQDCQHLDQQHGPLGKGQRL